MERVATESFDFVFLVSWLLFLVLYAKYHITVVIKSQSTPQGRFKELRTSKQ